jgi:benzoyl-CoA reductase subunit BamC
MGTTTNRVKEVKVNLDKCTGCRACEMACSAFHATPKYSSVNPARSRIRVTRDVLKDVYVPVRGTEYTPAECIGRHHYTIEGTEYPECSFCGVSCPARDLFKDPVSRLPLQCDMCSELPPDSEPLCVQVCGPGALTYYQRDAEPFAEGGTGELDVALQALMIRHGSKEVVEGLAKMAGEAPSLPAPLAEGGVERG